MSKKILGLDLGTTSIGWAFVSEAENDQELSEIHRIGVRVNPLTTDEQSNFEKGKPVSVNADRTLKRSARRNLQRYKMRRANLIEALLKNNIIDKNTVLAEEDKGSTHSTYALRADAATGEISKEAFARVLLMINKKRGYKSSRKAKNEEEGQAVDGMAVAKTLYEDNLTPGQFCYHQLKSGRKSLPDFYRSDLKAEFDSIWNHQKQFYPEILTDGFLKAITGKGQRGTAAAFWGFYKISTAEIKGTREEKKLQAYEWRSKAPGSQLTMEEVAFVIAEVNGNIHNSSGYLGAISDRSKELYFNKETIGQYLFRQLKTNHHARLKNQVFYRQDYLDEFERIWEMQANFHPELTRRLKEEIRDIIIFYQRKLKSQKGLVSFCEFESKEVDVLKNGRISKRKTGYKVTPKSSPLFQQFKIWQNLNSLLIKRKGATEIAALDHEAKQILFDELNLKGNLSKDEVLKILGFTPNEWELNFKVIEGNRTNKALYEAYLKILELEGYNVLELLKVDSDRDMVKLSELTVPALQIEQMVHSIFGSLGINTGVLQFNPDLEGRSFEKQTSYQLWHLLYSYEGDNSPSGNEALFTLMQKKFGFSVSQAKILSNISFADDYGNLSAKAIRKILPFIKENKYSEACRLAGYNHSSFLTKEENENRALKSRLELLPKNSLRNPVVEKILNQMVNVVNAVIDDPLLGKPDEIRIELARELKKNAEERAELSSAISKATAEHELIKNILIKEDGIKNPTRNDIIRYKLYQELKNNGYKTLYSNTYIPREKLFTKEVDIEHIIPRSLLFDDSYSNKTICLRKENLDKGNRCAADFVGPYFGEDKFEEFTARVEMLYQINQKNPGEGISKTKYRKLLMRADEIGQGFIERDLRDSQYIARKARQMLLEICKTVVPTTGSVTERLREDWGLVNIMQDLNIRKYRKLGLTEMVENKDGGLRERIVDWNKRNDQRHHAMDALTIAFTRHSHIQYLNNLNARGKDDKKGREIYGIEQKETELVLDKDGKRKRKFKSPLLNFREDAKKHLEAVLVSYKAKNKVVTKNLNRFKTKSGDKVKTQLTPRGQLHKETVYGSVRQYVTREEKVGSKFNESIINKVASNAFRKALLGRLKENGNNPAKAFTGTNSLNRNAIYLNEEKTVVVPDKIRLVDTIVNYTIRKDICPDLFKDSKKKDDFYNTVESIYDKGVRDALKRHYEQVKAAVEQQNDSAISVKDKKKVLEEAFSNLDNNPVWLNHEKGIAIKRVTIKGVKNVEALHFKKDHRGNDITDACGNKMPVDFVSTGSNHHVAIYRDSSGNLQDRVVSFYEAVERVGQGLPVVDKSFNREHGWKFLFTMKQNELFVFPNDGFDPKEIDLLDPVNARIISPNLYRMQKFSKVTYGNSAVRDYVFRHHLETKVDDNKLLKDAAYRQYKTLLPLASVVKVRINHLGKIVRVGEY